MNSHMRGILWLLVLTLVICCGLYPITLWAIGQTMFRDRAQGSLVKDMDGTVVGSRLIAQPFSGDKYFQPRPSAASYNATAASGSNWAANNYLLRDRVARQLGPIVKYKTGTKKGQLAAPDIEAWFQKDNYQGQPNIVAQWAQAHSGLAQAWVKADKLNAEYVKTWVKGWKTAQPADALQWLKDHADLIDAKTGEVKPEDLAGIFFETFSKANPGRWPAIVERKNDKGDVEKVVDKVRDGADIQAVFFDMW